MKVLILGGTGMLGPHVVPLLAERHELRVTDLRPPSVELDVEFMLVDVGNPDHMMRAAEGMDAIINLSVLRRDRKIAFDVNTLGCYNMMKAAVAHDIRRVINTGPHFAIAGASYETYDFDLSPDMPPQPGVNLYALTKSLGMEICRVFAEEHGISVQTYLFYNFRDPADLRPAMEPRPFVVSWQNAAEVFLRGLEIDLADLPSRYEVFNVFADMPHGKFSNEKAKRILGWRPRDDVSALWRRDDLGYGH